MGASRRDAWSISEWAGIDRDVSRPAHGPGARKGAGADGPYFEAQHDAKVAELVDAQDLGSCGATRPGSSPGFRINDLGRPCLTVGGTKSQSHASYDVV
jgi:hypothetical protein